MFSVYSKIVFKTTDTEMRVSNAADLDDLLGKLFQSLQTRVNKPRGEISVSFRTDFSPLTNVNAGLM